MSRTKASGACRHCGSVQTLHGRGLCQRCRRDPAVRAAYPMIARTRWEGAWDGVVRGDCPLPAEPTPYSPGTEEKLLVLAGRVDRREQLWHPGDAGVLSPTLGRPLGVPGRHTGECA